MLSFCWHVIRFSRTVTAAGVSVMFTNPLPSDWSVQPVLLFLAHCEYILAYVRKNTNTSLYFILLCYGTLICLSLKQICLRNLYLAPLSRILKILTHEICNFRSCVIEVRKCVSFSKDRTGYWRSNLDLGRGKQQTAEKKRCSRDVQNLYYSQTVRLMCLTK